MSKKNFLLALLLFPFAQQANYLNPWLEIKPSYFLFAASSMRNIYHKGGFEIQACASVPVWHTLNFYSSIGYRKAHGHALNTGEQTNLTVVPIDIGLKPIFNWHKHAYYFLGFGPRGFYFHQHNYTPYVDRKISSGNIGLFVNTGFNILIKEHFLIGAFGEYSYERKSINPKKTNVFSNGPTQLGGFAFGASLGRAF